MNLLVAQYHQKNLRNPYQYMVLIILCMIYMSIMLCNAILTNRYIGEENLFVLGGTFTSPIIFILDDIIAEIYGYKITRVVVITGFLSQTLFIVICQFVVNAPHPSSFNSQIAYNEVLGWSLVRINISGFVAYIVANLTNSYLLSRWKVLLKGRYFWLRSLGSSTISEALYSFIAILMMELASIPFKKIIDVVIISFSIKVAYTVIFAGPVSILVAYLKHLTGIDIYDLPHKFTPFKYIKNNLEYF